MYTTLKPQNDSLMHWLHRTTLVMKTIASVVAFAYLFLLMEPTFAAVQAQIGQNSTQQVDAETALSESFAEAVEKLALLKQLRVEDKDTDAVLGELTTLKSKMEELNTTVLENFAKVETDIKAKQLPAVILKRHTDMVSHYTTENQAFMDLLNKETDMGIIASTVRGFNNLIGNNAVTPDEAVGNTITDGDKTFSTDDFKRSHQEFDPDNLPTKAMQPDVNNKPKETKQEFIQSGLRSSPQIQIAALGDFTFNNLEEAANPLYLAESDEVQLSQEIKDKAATLNYDAVQIYHWVRNNIEWLPSWGAIQDAELTLEAQRGNAMDIASLTISLLRASGIPSRYVHGTIDVPVEKFKNWAGGFTSYEAAGNYASSAGIPITSIISGGQVKTMRMEHVWVEAAIDFQPSRGAKNKDADTWVQLDPSFKQYEFQDGLDVVAISGLDMDKLAQDFVDSGTVNEAEGWATGFDPSILQTAQATAQTKLEAHIATLNNPTVGDVIGGKKTIIKQYPTLPSSLPNPIKTIGTRYDKLPSQLQQKIEFAFGKDILGDMIDPISFPFAKLNNEKVTLSFKPATQADEDVLTSLIPEGIIDLSSLPDNIPSYLVQVIPELKVNGITVKAGSPMNLGQEINLVTGNHFAGRGYISPPRAYSVVVGSYLNVNVFAGSVSPKKLSLLQEKMRITREAIKSGNHSLVINLSREDIMGDLFYAGGLSYYAQLLSLSSMTGLKLDSHYQLSSGYGTVGFEPRVNTFFGIPRGVKKGSVVFNIPMINVTGNNDGDADKARIFTEQVGVIMSSLEHSVPELMFVSNDPNDTKLDAISAIKALNKAITLGQKIYHINQNNMDIILPLLGHDSNAINEIRSALFAGKRVTTHPNSVSINGWTGFGYTIIDPIVGDGAYKISGGANGSDSGDVSGLTSIIGTMVSVVEFIFDKTGIDSTRLGQFGAVMGISSALLGAVSLSEKCSKDIARVLILFATFLTLLSMVPGLLIGILLTPFGALLLGTALSFGFGLGTSYLQDALCEK